MQPYPVHVYPGWKGIDKNSIPGLSDPASIGDCDNIVLTLDGLKRKAPGTSQYHTGGLETLASPRFGIDFWRTSGSSQNQSIIVGGGGRFYADSGDGAFRDITGATALGTNPYMSGLAYTGLMILCVEGLSPYKYNMTGDISALGGTPPAAKYAQKFKRRTFLAGNPAAPHRLYRCTDVDDPESGYTNYLDIDAGASGGDEDPVGITALFPQWRDRMFVSKRNSLYYVYYTGDFTFPYGYNAVDCSHGCLEHNTVAVVPNDIIYVSERGVHSLVATEKYGDSESAFLSKNLQGTPSWWSENVDVSQAEYFWGKYVPIENSYFLSCRTKDATYNDLLLTYNLELKEWTIRKDWGVGAIFTAHDIYRYRKLMRLDNLGRVGFLDWDTMSDFDVLYNADFTTNPIIPTKMPNILHDFIDIVVYYRPFDLSTTSVYMTYWLDGVEIETLELPLEHGAVIGEAVIEVDTIQAPKEWQRLTLPLKGHGTTIKLKFFQNAKQNDDQFGIFGFTINTEVDEKDLKTLSLQEV